tara:strand:- start:1 stop:207 length:207 start_codon:yes stop_codon:yes gene_type:complete
MYPTSGSTFLFITAQRNFLPVSQLDYNYLTYVHNIADVWSWLRLGLLGCSGSEVFHIEIQKLNTWIFM